MIRYATKAASVYPTIAEGCRVWHSLSEKFDGTSKVVFFLHGVSSTALAHTPVAEGEGNSGAGNLLRALAQEGFLAVAIDAGGTTNYGNSACQTAITNAYNYFCGGSGGGKSGKCHLLAASMNGTGSMTWTKNNTTKVASVYLMAPVLDLVWAEGVATALVDAAYGGTHTTFLATKAGFDPMADVASIASSGIPVKIAAGSTDTTVPPANNATPYVAAANVSTVTMVSYPNVDHTHIFGIPPDDVIRFFRNNP